MVTIMTKTHLHLQDLTIAEFSAFRDMINFMQMLVKSGVVISEPGQRETIDSLQHLENSLVNVHIGLDETGIETLYFCFHTIFYDKDHKYTKKSEIVDRWLNANAQLKLLLHVLYQNINAPGKRNIS